MKHRSIGAFVILAATLFAIPEALQDIRSLKDAVLGRARGEILQAFLSFQTGDDPCSARRGRQAQPVLATGGDAAPATLASAARKRPARETAWATAREAEAREPREPADLFNEKGNGRLLIASAFADVVVEAASEVREEARGEVASVSLPRDARAVETVLASASSLPEWHKVAAAADELRKAEGAFKLDPLRAAEFERLLGARTRVRHVRVVKPGRKAPPAPLAHALEAPQPLSQIACDDPAADDASDDASDAASDAAGENTKW